MASNFLQQLPKLPNFGKFPGKLPGLYRPKKSLPEHQAAMVQRQASMSLIAPHGLQNLTGENNCFLNSAIQVLWHIDVFRRSFRELEGHTCVGKSCIFCALKDLFTQFQHSDQTTIPPDVLRHALAECYREKHRFQLNLMDDAAECFEKLLEQVHFHLTGNDDLDSCGASFCISHQCFALNILERTECVCGATSEPLSFVQFVHYISSSALVKEAQKYLNPKDDHTPSDPPTNGEPGRPRRNSTTSTFGKILHAASSYGEYRECPNFAHCKKNVAVKRILLNCPDVVCLGLIWDSDQPPVDDIMAVVNNIGLTLQLSDVFDTVSAENAHFNQYQLTAAIAYYGRHYSTFCLHSRKREWIYFDDANFRTIGTEWSDVCEVIRKAHYQPLLLVYSNQFAEKIDTSQAPTTITRMYPHNRKKVIPCVAENDMTKNDIDETSSGEHTIISNQSVLASTTPPTDKKPANEIQNGSAHFDQMAGQNLTLVNPSQPPASTEVIDPMTLSIMPTSAAKLIHVGENEDKSETTSRTSDHTSQQRDSNTSAATKHVDTHAQPTSSGSVVSTEPVADLMMFSLTPAAVARISSTPSFHSPGQAHNMMMHPTPSSQPDLLKIDEVASSNDNDLIEFSINPSLLSNVHGNSKAPYDFAATNRGSRSSSNSPLPSRVRSQSPELHTSRKSPELSGHMLKTDQKVSPQEKYHGATAMSSAVVGGSQQPQVTPVAPFQRQTSFPFQNKQPALLQSDTMKTGIHALPQSSDFANQFSNLESGANSKSDQLKPDWEHFAEGDEALNSEFISCSPETWTVLNTTGEEESTFKAKRQFSEDFVSTMTTTISKSDDRNASSEAANEEIKYTPAMTSLKRVANYRPEKPKSVSPVAGRPLPSVPHGGGGHTTIQPPTLPLRDNERGLPTSLASPMAHLSPNSSTAKFLAHPNHSQGSSSALSSATKEAPTSSHDPLYADPDELVFSKPSQSQQQTTSSSSLHGQKRQDAGKSNVPRTALNDTQTGGNDSNRLERENYVEIETISDEGANGEQKKANSKDKGFSASNNSSSDSKCATGGVTDKNDEFSSPPITADPLYALPEKLKLKFASQGAANGPSSTTAESNATSTNTTTASSSSITSTSSTSSDSITGQRPSKLVTTGAEYLNLLLQERQSARQQNTASLTTPTGDLLEASTKARAGSNIDFSPTTISSAFSIGNSTISTASLKTKHRSGKEYLMELLQKKGKQSSNADLAGQTPKYTMSNSSSASSGSNLRYTVAGESRFSTRQPAQTERQSNSGASVRSTVQPLYRSSNPVGKDSSSAVPGKQYGGMGHGQRVGRMTDTARKTSSDHRQVVSQKRIQDPNPAVMPAIPEHIHSRLLEARDLWAKAEASLPTDTTVAYMLFTQHNGIIARVLQDPAVKANPPLHQHVSNIKGEGSKRAMALKSSITSATPTTSSSSQGACQRCGNVRNLDSSNLCGPCQLRAQIGK